jgi:ArsR family metal-binding transcriptional regulator
MLQAAEAKQLYTKFGADVITLYASTHLTPEQIKNYNEVTKVLMKGLMTTVQPKEKTTKSIMKSTTPSTKVSKVKYMIYILFSIQSCLVTLK